MSSSETISIIISYDRLLDDNTGELKLYPIVTICYLFSTQTLNSDYKSVREGKGEIDWCCDELKNVRMKIRDPFHSPDPIKNRSNFAVFGRGESRESGTLTCHASMLSVPAESSSGRCGTSVAFLACCVLLLDRGMS